MFGDDTTSDYYVPDQAFGTSISGPQLFGEDLHKFSFSRKIAAQTMGCMAPSLPPDALAKFRAGLTYPGVWNDVIIVCWLCTLPDKIETADDLRAGRFTPDRAITQPTAAMEAARAWAESQKLDDMGGTPFFEAWKMFLQLMFAIDASLFDVEIERSPGPQGETTLPKEKPGHPKSRSSSRKSRGSAGKAPVLSGNE